MKLLISFLLLTITSYSQGFIDGWCESGATQVLVSGVQSDNYAQGSYPACTITVYLYGTSTLATIYSNPSSGSLTNPFTATPDGYYSFYAAQGSYSVQFSGAGILIPYLRYVTTAGGGGGGSGTTTPSPNAIPESYSTSLLDPGWLDYAHGQVATSTQNGFLSAANWVTFNGKQASGNYITGLTGDCSASGPGSVSITCLKTNGVSFASSATIDTTNASNISSGTLNNSRLSSIPNSALANDSLTLSITPTWLTSSGSAVLGGTITITATTGLTQNEVLATPNGSSGAVSLRSLVLADIPTIPLTSQVSGILPSANGGTNSQYFALTGPSTVRTFTFPDASTTVLTTNSLVTVPQGGSGAGTLSGVLLGNGTSAFTAVALPSSSTVFLNGNGTFSTPSGTGGVSNQALLDCGITRTSGTVLTVFSGASSTDFCSISVNVTPYVFTAGVTATISTGTPTVIFYVSDGSDGNSAGTVVACNSASSGVAVSAGMTLVNSCSTAPSTGGTYILGSWSASVSGTWNTTGTLYRSLMSGGMRMIAGANMAITPTSSGTTIATTGFTGTKTAGSCVIVVANGVITGISGC